MGANLTSFAENLNALSTARRQPLSHAEVARRLTHLGVPTTAAWVQLAREGRQTNPSAARVQALARVFGVPIGYFFDPEVTDGVNAALERARAGLG